METVQPTPTDHHISLRLNLRLVVLILLATIVAMIVIWKPWSEPTTTGDRTVKVTGSTTISAVPDEFIFYPTYTFKNADKAKALAALTKKSDEIVKKLKELGVANDKIKTNASNYDQIYYYNPSNGLSTYTLSITITVKDKDLTQKVTDYLVSTSPSGQLTPQASFSEDKRKQLENTARDQATKDARSKVDQMAKNLGFNIGKVKSVDDNNGFGGGPILYEGRSLSDDKSSDASTQLTIQPGENDLSYSVTVTYFIK